MPRRAGTLFLTSNCSGWWRRDLRIATSATSSTYLANLRQFTFHRYLRLLLFAVALIVCLLIIRAAAIFGFSRALTTYSLVSGNVLPGKRPLKLRPGMRTLTFAKAAVLSVAGSPEQSCLTERSVALRPTAIGFGTAWILRDQLGDTNGPWQRSTKPFGALLSPPIHAW